MSDKEGTEMARAAEEVADPHAAQFVLHPRLIVTDDDSIEESKRAERKVLEKKCFFKTADELTENPDICFCMDVAPECKDYRLQALVHKMDRLLLDDEADDDGDAEGENESVQDKIKKIERQQRLARTVFGIDPQKKKNKKIGRTVFYVTVGQMKHTQIFLKTVLL